MNRIDSHPAPSRSASDNGSFSNGLVTWSLGTLEPGASRTVTVMVNARSAGTARNTAKARAVCADAEASYAMEIKGIPAILLEVIDIDALNAQGYRFNDSGDIVGTPTGERVLRAGAVSG